MKIVIEIEPEDVQKFSKVFVDEFTKVWQDNMIEVTGDSVNVMDAWKTYFNTLQNVKVSDK